MPNIDLGPDKYTRKDPRTGKMVRDFSPRYMRNLFFVMIGVLAVMFWQRDQITNSAVFFGAIAAFAFCAGVFAANWLKNIY